MPSGAARDRQPTRQPTEIRHETPLEIPHGLPHGIPHEIPLEIPHGIPALMGAFLPRETRRISDLTLTLGEFRSSSIYQAARYISDLPTTERPRGDKHGPPRGTDVGLSTMTNIMPIPQGARLPQLQLHARDKCSTFTQSETGGPPSLAGRPTTLRVRRHLETVAAIQNERNAASIRDGSTQGTQRGFVHATTPTAQQISSRSLSGGGEGVKGDPDV